MDFAAQIPAVQTGKADMAMGAISVTEERQKQVLFSDGYVESHIVLITRKGEAGILTSPSQQPSDKLDDGALWPWAAALLITLGGGTWLFLRRKRRTPTAVADFSSSLNNPSSLFTLHSSLLFRTFARI
jgi:polar amino acid transport system substrate-binding protein